MAKTNLLTNPVDGNVFIFKTSNQEWNLGVASGTEFGANYTFSNSNNVSFTNNSSVIVASASFPVQSSLVYSNSNGVSFGITGSTLTASVSQNTNYIFQNSNNVSFTTVGSNVVASASYTVPSTAGLLSAINVSAGTTSNNISAITFSNSNNFTFGFDGSGVITGSVPQISSLSATGAVSISSNGNTISIGAPNVSSLSATGAVSISSNGSTISIGAPFQTNFTFSNSNNVSFSTAGSIVVGSASFPAQSSLVYSNSNNVSFGIAGSTLTASASFPAQTSLSYSNLNGLTFGIAGSTLTGSYTVPSTAGLISKVNISAGTTSNNLTNFVFSNSNGISFGLNGSTITASAAGGGSVNISAGTTSNNLTNFVFSNSNNFSFGLSGSTITGSYTVPTQTNQTIGIYLNGNTFGAASSATIDARSLTLSAQQNIFVGLAAGSVILNALPMTFSAGTTSGSLNNIIFSNSNGVSFGLNGSTITGSVPALSSLSATGAVSISSNGNTISIGAPAVSSLSATGIISISSNGSTISIGAPIQSINFSAGATSNNYNSIVFSNSNNFSFGLSGSTITASYNFSISGGTSSNFGKGITFTNSNNMSFTNNAGVIAAKAAPKESEIINDSTVFGTAGSDALNNLLLEFPNGVGSASATSITINSGSMGQLTLLTGVGVTITVPTLLASGLKVGCRVVYLLYGSGATITTITNSGGVTIHLPTVYPIDRYTRFNFDCIATDEWVISAEQLQINSSGVTNFSTATGTTVTNALTFLYGYMESTSVGIVPCATPVSWNWGTTAGGYWAWTGAGVQGTFWGALPTLPNSGTLLTLSVTIRPVSHTNLPTNMPQFRLFHNIGLSTGAIFLLTDSSTLAVYNAAHTITGTITAPAGTVAGNNFVWEVIDEGGTNSHPGLEILNILLTLS